MVIDAARRPSDGDLRIWPHQDDGWAVEEAVMRWLLRLFFGIDDLPRSGVADHELYGDSSDLDRVTACGPCILFRPVSDSELQSCAVPLCISVPNASSRTVDLGHSPSPGSDVDGRPATWPSGG